MMISLPAFVVRGLVPVVALGCAVSANATLISESFHSSASAGANGWTTFNNNVNGNVLGVTNATDAGGVAAGEGFAHFRRSTSRVYYADTDLGGSLGAGIPLSFSGKLDASAIVGAPDFGAGAYIAYFNTGSDAKIGLVFNDSGANLTWGLRIIDGPGAGGLVLGLGLDGPHAFGANVNRTFSVVYDPLANGGLGAVTGTVSGAGSALVANLTSTQRARLNALTFNAFGFEKPVANSTALQGADFRMDDVTYTVVPEPSLLLLVATGAGVVWRRFRRRSRA